MAKRRLELMNLRESNPKPTTELLKKLQRHMSTVVNIKELNERK